MSDSAKRIEASTLRSGDLVEELNFEPEQADGRTGHDVSATEDGQECRGVPPTWCVHAERVCASRRFETLLQFKGFGGGVPQNTERATVKPWVGIAR